MPRLLCLHHSHLDQHLDTNLTFNGLFIFGITVTVFVYAICITNFNGIGMNRGRGIVAVVVGQHISLRLTAGLHNKFHLTQFGISERTTLRRAIPVPIGIIVIGSGDAFVDLPVAIIINAVAYFFTGSRYCWVVIITVFALNRSAALW